MREINSPSGEGDMMRRAQTELGVAWAIAVFVGVVPCFAEAEEAVAPEVTAVPAPTAAPAPVSTADLVRQLRALDVAARIRAVAALGERGGQEVTTALIAALRSEPSPDVRRRIIRFLAEDDGERARAAICQSSHSDMSDEVRSLGQRFCPEEFASNAAPSPMVLDINGLSGLQLRLLAHRLQPYFDEAEAVTPNRRRIRAGWVLFAVGAVSSVVFSIINTIFVTEAAAVGLVPVIGPFIAGPLIMTSGGWGEERVIGVITMLVGAIQTAGFALAISGHVRQRREQREAEGEGEGEPESRVRPFVALTPAGIVGTF